MKNKIIIGLIVFVIFYAILYFMNYNYTVDNNIPIVKIKLKDTTLDYINSHDKENKYENNKIEIYNHGKKEFASIITFKGRGNSTWKLKKKPYQISFDEKQSILGLKESKKYIFLANQADTSLFRNDFSYSIAKRMNLNYSFNGEFVDFYVDNKYVGNYYVTPKIGINKSTINIKDEHSIVMELDNTYYMDEEHYFKSSNLEDYIVLKDSNNKNPIEDMKVFEDKYNEMEKAIIQKNYSRLEELIDIDSFAKYYIISEFSKNYDSIHSSLFFYMDGVEDKIHIGPIWDCDLTYGNKSHFPGDDELPLKNHAFPENNEYSYLFYNLLKIEEFSNKVKEVWKEVGKESYKKEIKELKKKTKRISLSGTYNNNYWNKINFDTATNELIEWIENRYKFFNKYMEE